MRVLYKIKYRDNYLFLLFLVVSFFVFRYFPNMGGVGLNLPVNTLVYAASASLILLIWLRMVRRRSITITSTFRYFFLGGIMLSIPLLFTRPEWLPTAAWRMAAFFAGLALYFSWLQLPLNRHYRRTLYVLLLLLIVQQAGMALLQLFAPEWSGMPPGGRRVSGVFQQPNVLGSFIATGLGLTLMLYLLPRKMLAVSGYGRYHRLALALLLVLLPALLIWIQSRAAWLGSGLMALGFCLSFWRHQPLFCAKAVGLMSVGLLLGITVMQWQHSEMLRYISHESSNHARLSMLMDTLAMIIRQPLSGWGYGGFEFSFQHFRINQSPPTAVLEIARHPHNEILLWWVEGGLLALMGMAMIAVAGGLLLIRAMYNDRQAWRAGRSGAGEATALCWVLVPILIHSQLEYPFYISAAHWVLFLLLLATLDGLTKKRIACRRVGSGILVKGGMLVMAVMIISVMIAAFRGGIELTAVERNGMRDIEPLKQMSPLSAWVHDERREFDLQINALMSYNQTNDELLLVEHVTWARAYLLRRIDVNVYASLITILRHQRRMVLAERYRLEAAMLFPADRRFSDEPWYQQQ